MNIIVNTGIPGALMDFRDISPGVSITKVFEYCCVQKSRLLGDIANPFSQGTKVIIDDLWFRSALLFFKNRQDALNIQSAKA